MFDADHKYNRPASRTTQAVIRKDKTPSQPPVKATDLKVQELEDEVKVLKAKNAALLKLLIKFEFITYKEYEDALLEEYQDQ